MRQKKIRTNIFCPPRFGYLTEQKKAGEPETVYVFSNLTVAKS
jgi:hypothetical protein